MRRYFNQGTQKPQTRKAGAGLGALGGSKKKKNMEEKVSDAAVDNIFAKFNRRIKKAEKQYKDIPSGMKKDPKTRAEIQAKLANKALKDRKPFQEFKDTRREVFATERMAKGGRVGYKKGSGFPDLNKDGKVTKADILMGRGVIGKKKTKKKKMKAYKSPMQKQVRKS